MTAPAIQERNMEMFRSQAKRGLRLFPLIGKKPEGGTSWKKYCENGNGFHESDFINRNAGVACGSYSKLLVIDVDDPVSFEHLAKANDLELPDTYTVRTGRNGFHYYYRYPSDGMQYGNKSLKHPSSYGHTIFDVRGEGGYVVAAGSIHPDNGRQYTVEMDLEIADCPQWLKDYVLGERIINREMLWEGSLSEGKASDLLAKLPVSDTIKQLIKDGMPKGDRSEAIAKVIIALNGKGVGDKDINFIFDNFAIGEKYRQKGNKQGWLADEIRRAKEYVVRENKDKAGCKIPDATAISEIDSESLEDRAKAILNASEPCGPFKTDGLPPLLQEYILAICNTTEADPIAVTQSVLCTLSAFLRKRCYLPEGEYFQRLYPNLWTLTIAPSGNYKTTALNKGARLAYKEESKIQKEIKDMEPSDNPKKGQQEDTPKRLEILRKSRLLIPQRITAEGLLKHLAEGSGGMIVCSEFGEWLENLSRSHNQGLKTLITDLYDVPFQYSYRTSGEGLLVINEPFITINGVSTLAWVRANIKPNDVFSGFFARFLIFFPPQKEVMPPALPRRNSAELAGEARIKEILDNLPDQREYRLSEDAKQLYESYHKSLYLEIVGKDEKTREMLGPYRKRWSPYLLKIAMILQPFIDDKTDLISADAIKGAKSVVDYAIKSTTYLFQNDLGESEQQRKHRRVKEYIAKKGGEVTHAVLQKSKVLDGGTKEYEFTIESLESAGDVIVHKNEKKGDWVYVLNLET